MKWKCKTDILLFGKKLADKGDVVFEGQTLSNGSVSINIDKDLLSNGEVFEKVQDVSVKSKELNREKEETEKEWIIELKVKTTRSNLRKIEEFLITEVEKFL